MDEVLRAIAEAAAELIAVPLASIWVANEAARTLEFRTASDPMADDVPAKTVAYGEGGAGWVALHRGPLEVADIARGLAIQVQGVGGVPRAAQRARGAHRVPGHAAGGALPQRARADPAGPRRPAAPRELRGAGGRGDPQRGPLRRDPRPARGEPGAPRGGRDPQLDAGFEATAARGHQEDRPGVPGGPLLHPALGGRPRGAAHVAVRRRSRGPRRVGPVPPAGRVAARAAARCTRAPSRRGGR